MTRALPPVRQDDDAAAPVGVVRTAFDELPVGRLVEDGDGDGDGGGVAGGFDLYRAFPRDARDDAESAAGPVDTPLPYVRGDREGGDIEAHARGFRAAGVRDPTTAAVAGAGHFAQEERPAAVRASCATSPPHRRRREGRRRRTRDGPTGGGRPGSRGPGPPAARSGRPLSGFSGYSAYSRCRSVSGLRAGGRSG
ncbi:hypothetical protein [Kitasatospora sp. NPDC096204]|uniref:hypothetical protein n=1 Tax=Kitasatospora sp. NPDC096204 TaxID=3364094 RepID=UPI00380F368B